MSGVERVILFAFGGIMLSAAFVLYQFGRVLLIELKDRKTNQALEDHPAFGFSMWLCLLSVGILGNAAVRVRDGFVMEHFGGSTPVVLAVFLIMIWIAASGFHWLASRRRRLPWNLYIASILGWIAVVTWPLIP